LKLVVQGGADGVSYVTHDSFKVEGKLLSRKLFFW